MHPREIRTHHIRNYWSIGKEAVAKQWAKALGGKVIKETFVKLMVNTPPPAENNTPGQYLYFAPAAVQRQVMSGTSLRKDVWYGVRLSDNGGKVEISDSPTREDNAESRSGSWEVLPSVRWTDTSPEAEGAQGGN